MGVEVKSLRSAVKTVIAARRFNLDPHTKRTYTLDQEVAAAAIDQVDKDLPRTLPDEPLVCARVGWIRAILLQQLAEDPQLGYCQGMSFVAAAFVAAADSKFAAYERFHSFIEGLRGLWLPGFPMVIEGFTRFNGIARDCEWYQHMRAHDISLSMFLPQAMMTVLATWLPLQTLAECLELPERYGLDGLVAMIFSVLDLAKERLMQQQSMEGILKVLRSLHDSPPQSCKLESSVHDLVHTIGSFEHLQMSATELFWRSFVVGDVFGGFSKLASSTLGFGPCDAEVCSEILMVQAWTATDTGLFGEMNREDPGEDDEGAAGGQPRNAFLCDTYNI